MLDPQLIMRVRLRLLQHWGTMRAAIFPEIHVNNNPPRSPCRDTLPKAAFKRTAADTPV